MGRREATAAARAAPLYPATFARYLEPFVGSGAVFLDLHNSGLLDGRRVRLSDINADVIGCYQRVRDAVDSVIDELRRLDEGHRSSGRDHFYDVRDGHFNPQRRTLHAGPQAPGPTRKSWRRCAST